MLCQKCKQNNATSHIHYVRNGIVRDMYLCNACASDFKTDGLYDGDVFKMLSSLLNNNKADTKNTVRCDCCGTDFDEIRKTGKVGCGNCYRIFEKQLSPTIARLHGKTVHVGKIPSINKINKSISNDENPAKTKEQIIAELKNDLASAIKNEEYEKAAVIRDRIKEEEA